MRAYRQSPPMVVPILVSEGDSQSDTSIAATVKEISKRVGNENKPISLLKGNNYLQL